MEYADYNELMQKARDFFVNGKYKLAEPLLKQMLLLNATEPEVYQMLATIFYDQGKFNKAIQTFKRALEIDPSYTDASVGLSIILNDLGRYDEGKQVFVEAEKLLQKRKSTMDPQVEEKIALKHIELGSLYDQFRQYSEAVEQYFKALRLTRRKEDCLLKIMDAFVNQKDAGRAIREAKKFLEDYPQSIGVRLKLGIIYYNANKILDAVEQWENILARNPEHLEAKNFIQLASRAGMTELNDRPL